jgi:DNA-binding SARP family transcriptional activator
VVRFSVLGTLEVQRDEDLCELGPRKQRALLVRLLLDVNRPVSVDRLIDDLWGGTPPNRAMASLQAYVSNLRRILEPDRPARAPATVLVTQPPGYALRVPEECIDAFRFRALAAEAMHRLQAGEARDAHEAAEAGLALWRGPAFGDVADERFAAAEIRRLDDLRLSTEEVRLAAALDLGRSRAAAAELESWVEREPLRERFWELLILALYRSGRAADALDRYQQVRRLLDDELGLEPGPALRELEQAVLRQEGTLLPRQAIPPTGPGTPPTGPSGPDARPGLDEEGRPPLAGRDGELAGLRAALSAASAGATRWVLLTGEAGIGKSRLAGAVADLALDAGWHVARARCHDDADTPPYWLWTQALRGLPCSSGALDPLAPADLEARERRDGWGGSRFTLYQGIEHALVAAVAETPLLLLLDDLQWADLDSLRALRYLAVELRGAPVMVVGTVRDGEGSELLHQVLQTIDRQPGAQRLPVPPVDLGAVRTIAEAVTGSPVTDEAGRRLHERSGGNPFFATELVRLSIAAGGMDAVLPAGVRDAVGRRLDRLPRDVRAVLTLAAVSGLVFDATVLAPASERGLPELLDLLDAALATGVLVEDEALQFRFSHALLRETLLAELTTAQRRRLHARLAGALRERRGDDERALPELAHHLVEAGPMGELSQAPDVARRAGEQALGRLAYDDAARWFDRALGVLALRDAVAGADLRARHELLVAKGAALYYAGRASEARQTLVTAIAAAAELRDPDAVGEAAAALADTGGIWTWVDLGRQPVAVLDHLERALQAVGPGDTPARARLLSMLAVGSYFGDDADRIERLSVEALAVARRVDDRRTLADVLLDRSFLLWGPDRCPEAVALADEALSIGELTDLQRVVAHGRRFVAMLFLGELPAAVKAHGEAVETARRAQLLPAQILLAQVPVAKATAEGRFADAETLLAESWALHERGDVPIVPQAIVSLEIVLRRHQGRLGEHVDALEALLPALPLRTTHKLLALAHLDAGDVEGADSAMRAAAEAPSVRWMQLLDKTIEAEIRAALPPTEAAAGLADELAPYEDMIAAAGTTYWWAPVALSLAALEHRLGRLHDAEGHLRRCLERCRRWGTRAWTVRAQWQLAAVLTDRGDADAEAAALRTEAETGADQLGMALPSPTGRRLPASGHGRSKSLSG